MSGKKHHPRTLAPRYWCIIDSCGTWGYGNAAYINEIVGTVWICKAHYSWVKNDIGKILSDYIRNGDKDKLIAEINNVYERVTPKTVEESRV